MSSTWTLTLPTTLYTLLTITGNIIVKENVTETQFSFKTSDNSCPVYQVSAGDEGELSAPVWDSTPQGNEIKNVL